MGGGYSVADTVSAGGGAGGGGGVDGGAGATSEAAGRSGAGAIAVPAEPYISRFPLPPLTPLSVVDVYDVGDCIGRGGFASVHRATNRESGEKVALKFMVVGRAAGGRPELSLDCIYEEIRIMHFLSRERKPSHEKELSTMHTPRLFHWFVSPRRGMTEATAPVPERIVVANTFAEGGPLYDVVKDDTGTSYKAVTRRMNLARRVLKAVCKELVVLHGANLVHNDIKLENVLIKEPVGPHDGDAIPASILTATFLLADVGLVRDLDRLRKGFSPLHDNTKGTAPMRAPELKEESGIPLSDRNPTFSSDMYAAGLLAFLVLTHYDVPNFGVTSPAWQKLPEPAKALIRDLLATDASKRPSAAAVLDSIFKDWYTQDFAVANAVAEGALQRPRLEAPLTLSRTPKSLHHALGHHAASLRKHARAPAFVDFARKNVADFDKLARAFIKHHPKGLADKAALREALSKELNLSVKTVDALLNNDRLYDLIDSDHSGHIDVRVCRAHVRRNAALTPPLPPPNECSGVRSARSSHSFPSSPLLTIQRRRSRRCPTIHCGYFVSCGTVTAMAALTMTTSSA
jgi:serine/threonine protein kinase